MPTRQDPIRENYYKSLEIAEMVGGWLFYFSATLSFLPIFIKQDEHPDVVNVAIILFTLFVIAFALLGIISRLYLFPRAEEARRKELLSTAIGIELIHERTVAYYNNDEQEPFNRLGMMLLEDTFFTMRILRTMAVNIRWKTGIFVSLWLLTLLWRGASLDWVSIVTTVIFSEEILSRWLRFEWQRMKVEKIFEKTRSVLQLKPKKLKLQALIIDDLISYESTKAVGGILLDNKTFNQLNPSLTMEWERIKTGLLRI